MRHTHVKKFLALLLAVCLLVGALPMAASAATSSIGIDLTSYATVVQDIMNKRETGDIESNFGDFCSCGFLYDIDGNGVKELILAYSCDHENAYHSVYTKANNKVIPLIEEEKIRKAFCNHGGVISGIVSQNGKIYYATMYTDGKFELSTSARKLFTLQENKLVLTTSEEVKSENVDIGNQNYDHHCYLNGKEITNEQYLEWFNSATWLAECHKKSIHNKDSLCVGKDFKTLLAEVRDYEFSIGETVAVTGISLNKSSLELKEGETAYLTATVKPADADNKAVTWSSSNTSVATVTSGGTVKAVSEGTATITVKTSDGGYTTACAVTVSPKTTDLSTQFSDVHPGAYYADAVKWAVESGITSGTDKTHFSPNQSCTRAQAVTFLWRAAGKPEPAGNGKTFADVSANAYYAKAVQWAVEQGITSGTSETRFSPDSTCTRAQIVTFLYRAAKSPNTTGADSFGDVPGGAYYEKAVKWAVENKITSGTGGNRFSPEKNCVRSQIVTFLYRSR